MANIAIQSVKPSQTAQTLAGAVQGQSPIDAALFGSLVGGFSDAVAQAPTSGVVVDPSLTQSNALPVSPLDLAALAQNTAQPAGVVTLPPISPDDTLGLLSSSIQTAASLSVAVTDTPSPVVGQELPLAALQSSVDVSTPVQVVPTQVVPTQVMPTLAVQVQAQDTGSAPVTLMPEVATQVQTQAVVTQTPQAPTTPVLPVQVTAANKVIAENPENSVIPKIGAEETEFQRLSSQDVKSEGDVAISSLVGQPFFNPVAEDKPLSQDLSDTNPLTVQSTQAAEVLNTAALVVNGTQQTMAHQAVQQQSPIVAQAATEKLTTAVSLGDEQGAPIFATYTSVVKESGAGSTAHYDTPTNSTMNTAGMAVSAQQSNAGQQQGQSNQQKNDDRANAALSTTTTTSSSTSLSADTDGFASMLSSLSPTLQTGAAPLANPLTAPVSLRNPQWTQEMGNRMQMMVSQRLKEVEVRLDPAELGPVRIHLKMDEDNKAHVTLSAQHGLTRDMLENAMPRLREMLAQQGVDVGSTNVDSGAQQQTADQQQQQNNQNNRADLATDVVNPVTESAKWTQINGLVDQFA
jgi:flagellar hook-length control protein FliK